MIHGEETAESALMEELDRLRFVTRRLRWLGMQCFTMVLATTALTVASSITDKLAGGNSFQLIIVSLGGVMIVMGLTALFAWEREKDRGSAIYEEVSDELEWDHRSLRGSFHQSDESAPERRPDLNIRLALREYLRNAKLPLVSAESGATFYLLTYGVCIIGLVVSVRYFEL